MNFNSLWKQQHFLLPEPFFFVLSAFLYTLLLQQEFLNTHITVIYHNPVRNPLSVSNRLRRFGLDQQLSRVSALRLIFVFQSLNERIDFVVHIWIVSFRITIRVTLLFFWHRPCIKISRAILLASSLQYK